MLTEASRGFSGRQALALARTAAGSLNQFLESATQAAAVRIVSFPP